MNDFSLLGGTIMNNERQGKLVVVSNRLPFQLVTANEKYEMRESDGGLVSALRSHFESADHKQFSSIHWIGAADFSQKSWLRFHGDKSKLAYDVDPVFIDKKVYHKYYNGFCNSTLWPLFHYFPSFVEFDNETFQSYEEVNRLFSEQVLKVLQPGDTLWIHDYQLMLLPGMIKAVHPHTPIGFFLHIPFPSFEIFRLLHRPWKEKIIDGLLSADLIGFHTHEYVQHFLKSVQMIKGYDHRYRSILLPDRTVKAEMFPLGIDYDKFNHAIGLPEVVDHVNTIKRNFEGKKIIFSVDRLDYTKGITHRLAGFEYFLKTHPEWYERVVFILVVVPSRQIVLKYNERKKMIEEEIGRINGRYSTLTWQPVIYRYNQLSFSELVAMYHAADVGLITPLRDGMNLVAKEYMACRKTEGVLILSELAGASSELAEALLVNPMDREEVAHAILQALMMSPEEQLSKINLSQQRLKEYTVNHWINDFMRQLDETKLLQRQQKTKLVAQETENKLIEEFTSAKRRLVLLDYDGTLVPFAKHPELASPDNAVFDLLRELTTDPATDVAIVSGRDRHSLESWFGDFPVHIVSEHGAEVRFRDGRWMFNTELDQTWKGIFRPIFELFTMRSPGAFIEEKQHTLVWHYRNVEPGLGFLRSRELLDSLHHMVRNSTLNILDGNKVIEIRMEGIDKGSIASKFIERELYEIIVAIGDDKTDEDMFRVLGHSAYTIKIGTGQTLANYYLQRQSDVPKLLKKLIARQTELHSQ
jgi:trehalose 6-phosphate synthase/phosphatase